MENANAGSRRVLTLFDCICIIVGTIIGAGIFQFPGVVASHLPSLPWFFGVWIFGGMVALIGALCFAELTTTYPDAGGDYGYLKRAYHPHLGFAFSWTAFWVIRPGNIGALAMIFGKFAVTFLEQVSGERVAVMPVWIGVIVVTTITALNFLGVVFSKRAQNCLTTAKVAGILIVLGGALTVTLSKSPNTTSEKSQTGAERANETSANSVASLPVQGTESSDDLNRDEEPATIYQFTWSSFWLAMVFVMFTFGGWNDIAFVACEVEEPRRNLLKSLVFGTLVVLAIYLLVNISLVVGLGMRELAEMGSRWENPTAQFVDRTIGSIGATLFSALVCVSCLGGINAMIFTSPRIYWATAQDYPSLEWLAGSNSTRKGWWRSMALQCVVTIGFMGFFGRRENGIDNLVAATAPYFWLFLGLTVVGLVVNRWRYAGQFEGFRVPCYPLTPLIFVAACGFMMTQSWSYLLKQDLGFSALLIGVWVVLGVFLSFILNRISKSSSLHFFQRRK